MAKNRALDNAIKKTDLELYLQTRKLQDLHNSLNKLTQKRDSPAEWANEIV